MKNQPKEAKLNIEPLSFSEELARAVINSLSAHIAILDKTVLSLKPIAHGISIRLKMVCRKTLTTGESTT